PSPENFRRHLDARSLGLAPPEPSARPARFHRALGRRNRGAAVRSAAGGLRLRARNLGAAARPALPPLRAGEPLANEPLPIRRRLAEPPGQIAMPNLPPPAPSLRRLLPSFRRGCRCLRPGAWPRADGPPVSAPPRSRADRPLQ